MFCIRLSYSLGRFIIFKSAKPILFCYLISNRLYIFFPVTINISVLASVHSSYRIEYNMTVHMFMVVMNSEDIFITITKVCFAKFFAYFIACCFITCSRRKGYYIVISLTAILFSILLLSIHHAVIYFIRSHT